MSRRTFVPTLIALMWAASRAIAQDDPDLVKALALQKVMQKTIQQNEASIACILVSRSSAYPHDPKTPGKLGIYQPELLKLDPNWSEKDRLLFKKKHDLANLNNVPPAFGSGVVVDPDGLILTNYHVVQDATKIYVRLPAGKGSYADIHAADPRSDLAVLRLLQPVGPLKAVALGEAEKLERGQFVLTLANPFAAGFRDGQPSASWGILSNIRRRAPTNLKEEERVKPLHHYGTLLQTDARMHLGSSGGALLNLHGEMVGLITSMAAIQGGETPGGFAVPVNTPIRRIIDVLKRGEEVDYGFLGVAFDDRLGNGHPQGGIILTHVGPGSPADIDGKLKSGDVLMAVNAQPILESDDVYLNIGTYQAGTKVKLHVRRANGLERIVEVTLAKLHVPTKPIASSNGARPFFRGLRVDWTSLVVQMEPRQPTIPAGVLITEVQADSAADRASLRTGDIITHVNQISVKTPSAFYQFIANARGPLELTLHNTPPTKVILK